jgi:hypothetical protein
MAGSQWSLKHKRRCAATRGALQRFALLAQHVCSSHSAHVGIVDKRALAAPTRCPVVICRQCLAGIRQQRKRGVAVARGAAHAARADVHRLTRRNGHLTIHVLLAWNKRKWGARRSARREWHGWRRRRWQRAWWRGRSRGRRGLRNRVFCYSRAGCCTDRVARLAYRVVYGRRAHIREPSDGSAPVAQPVQWTCSYRDARRADDAYVRDASARRAVERICARANREC